jgi:molecular chaperone DnaK (HSP70)
MASRFVVGIDLGTTHTVVAYSEIDPKRKGAPDPRIFEVAQLVTPRERDALAMLPSCLYAPLAGEVDGDPQWVAGELARKRGAEVVGRSVVSAKSWLSYASVDRLAPILPWGAPDAPEGEATRRISPVDASARLLAHIREAWDRDLPDAPLAEQDVVLTLPASFDEVARELTLRAAELAGLHPMLLEEPTAAFYAAMRGERAIRELASAGGAAGAGAGGGAGAEEATVLVCDVGGGTTDLSLMGVAKASAPPWFSVRRIAVGRHILLGGDNMDLALAHVAEARLAKGGGRLETAELAQLVLSCRDAKERILGATAADDARVTVLGRGSKLVGGARSTTLKREEVERVVLGGFFPEVAGDADLAVKPRGGIVSFGLPYERDPAITRHVRQFLARHAGEMPRGGPDALLLNGGVFNAKPIVEALIGAIAGFGAEAPSVLPGTDPDLAVARGAVLYGFARRGVGVRIESGASHGYYVALAPEREGGEARAVCILPRGAKEGVRHEAGRRFELLVGRSVRFDLLASDVARDEAGALVSVVEDAFERLPPVVARLPASGKEEAVPVHLGGELLSTGQLELACTEAGQAGAAGRKYRLEFQLRDAAARATSMPPPPPASLVPARLAVAQSSPRVSIAPSKLGDAERVLDRVFGKKNEADPRETKDVLRDLEKILGDRVTWTMEVTRALADRLLVNTGSRRRTAAHERAYWLLLGYCLRPGFGDPGDPSRIEKTWPMFEGRLAFPDEPRGWQQFFIAWRRVSGGLDEAMQTTIRDAFDPVIAPPDAKLKKPKRVPEAPDELLATLAALERVPVARRVQLGEWILEKTWGSDDPRLWGAIGRVGARVPVYASVHHVVSAKTAEGWLDRLLKLKWESVATAPHASVQLARVTGDRARDVSEKLRAEVAKKLTAVGAKDAWVRAVRELVDVGEEERVAILGEGLPIGLRLKA